MKVEMIGRPTTLYLVGESHCIQFGNSLARPAGIDETFLCRARYLREVIASNCDSNFDLLLDAFKAEGIIDRNGNADWLVREVNSVYLSGQPMLSPPIVFFMGDVDLQALFRMVKNEFDFELPDDPGYGADRTKTPITCETVSQQIEQVFRPFVVALQSLRALFPQLMVHDLPPRTRDDAKAARWTGGLMVDAAVRAKITILANRHLAAICAAMDIPFLDTWAETSLDGYLHPDFELDGLHLSQRAAAVSLGAVVAALYDHTGPTHNPFRYQLLRSGAPEYDRGRGGSGSALSESWAEAGFAAGRVEPAAVGRWADQLHFVADPPNSFAHPHWVGYPRAGRPGMAVADLSPGLLEEAMAWLGSVEVRDLFQVGEDKDYGLIALRAIALPPNASADAATLPTPFESRRALLCLDDNGAIDAETVSGEAIGALDVGQGALVVYDPKRVRCRARAGEQPARFAEIGLIHRLANQPFRIMAPGLGDWPADPFHYTVKDLPAWPPFDRDLIHERSPS